MVLARAIIAIAILLVSFAARAEKRVALVIGNSAYQTVAALTNPVRDAKAVAAALREAGFADADVIEAYDLSKAKFDEALKRFGDAASDADWALIFYAGHGIGIGGETYVLPVDAVLKRAEHADDEAISLSRLRYKASGAKALRVVILDSCRENPFAARLAGERGAKRAISRGLPAPTKPEGDELIAYATRENDVADDGEGGHSPFTAAFLRHLREPALEVRFLFGKVRDSVQAATSRQQTPTTYGDLGGTYFYFRPPKAETETPKPQPLSEAAEAWRAVEHSDSEAMLEAFIKRFGETIYGDFARARLAELRTKVAVAKPPAETPKPAPEMHYEDRAQRLVRTFSGHMGEILSIAFSPDGRRALSGTCDHYELSDKPVCTMGSLKLWDIVSGGELSTFVGHKKDAISVAISPDGRFALSDGGDKTHTLKLWDIATGRELRSFKGHTDDVMSVAISPDGRFALSGSRDKTLKLWDIASARLLRSFSGHTSQVNSVAISPNGRVALSSSDDKTLRVWDLGTGRELHSFTGHDDLVEAVAISPDGRFALSGSADRTLKLWDISSGRELRSLTGHENAVMALAFSPNGCCALSGSVDGALKLWDIASGGELRTFVGQGGMVNTVAISPDSRFALSGGCAEYSKDGTCTAGSLKLWDISEWTQPQEARR